MVEGIKDNLKNMQMADSSIPEYHKPYIEDTNPVILKKSSDEIEDMMKGKLVMSYILRARVRSYWRVRLVWEDHDTSASQANVPADDKLFVQYAGVHEV